ncbi:MAG: tRNA (adenosine(37)-N6)-dimethylallyltransferase MiaA [Deferrisomatales bacterium]|nr:tRNA (adenosine(37)-N6)-dimethylallyltransferase MiaA [Deferrisomatales bacterium]
MHSERPPNVPHSPPLVVITGPTAAGKSALALQVAEELGGEIISADSMQVYRHLDIGTAKPGPAERARVPHHLVDYVDPVETYHVARFLADAEAAVRAVAARGAVPVVCGGTALYLRALLYGLAPGPGRDVELRRVLEARWDAGEGPALWEELGRADPELKARLHPNDRTRVIRGLEVWAASGRPLSAWQRGHGFAQRRSPVLLLGVHVARDELYRRIDARVLRMVDIGWVEEVRGVLAAGYSPESPPLQAIGYRQLCAWLLQGGDLQQTVAAIQRQTRHFAKRQLTWFRRLEPRWVASGTPEEGLTQARKFLQTCPPSL